MNFSCNHCDQQFEAGEEWAGQSFECPTCGGVFVAPQAIAAPAPTTIITIETAPPLPPPTSLAPVRVKPRLAEVQAPQAPMRPPVSTSYIPAAEPRGGGFSTFVMVFLLLTVGGFIYACYNYDEPPRQVLQRLFKQAAAGLDQSKPQPAAQPKDAPKKPAPLAMPNADQHEPAPTYFGEQK